MSVTSDTPAMAEISAFGDAFNYTFSTPNYVLYRFVDGIEHMVVAIKRIGLKRVNTLKRHGLSCTISGSDPCNREQQDDPDKMSPYCFWFFCAEKSFFPLKIQAN